MTSVRIQELILLIIDNEGTLSSWWANISAGAGVKLRALIYLDFVLMAKYHPRPRIPMKILNPASR